MPSLSVVELFSKKTNSIQLIFWKSKLGQSGTLERWQVNMFEICRADKLVLANCFEISLQRAVAILRAKCALENKRIQFVGRDKGLGVGASEGNGWMGYKEEQMKFGDMTSGNYSSRFPSIDYCNDRIVFIGRCKKPCHYEESVPKAQGDQNTTELDEVIFHLSIKSIKADE